MKTIESSNYKYVVFIQVSFLIVLSIFYMSQGIFPSLEFIIAITIAALVWKSSHRALLLDLMPFFILLLTFQGLRSFADNLTPMKIHITDLINYEKILFSGIIPSHYLQSTIGTKAYSYIIEIPSGIFYMSHFLVPVVISIILWYRKKELYWYFLIGLILLTYAGFVTYVLYPAAPPWWATKYGYLMDQPVYLTTYAYPTVIEFAGPNPVAAMPSLHMAWPTFISLYCVHAWGKKLLWMLILPLGVGFSAVYLGHHYVIDLIVGVIYAVIFYWITIFIQKHKFNNLSKNKSINNAV